MHFQSIEIKNFRRFEQFECAFDPHFTLLMGANGTGKTSLLRAVWCACFDIARNLKLEMPTLENSDVRRIPSLDPADELWLAPVFPCSLDIVVKRLWPGSRQIPLGTLKSNLVNGPFSKESERKPNALWPSELEKKWLLSEDAIPLLARFDAVQPSGSDAPQQMGKPFEDKKSILALVNQGSVNIQNLAQWFQYNEIRKLQEGKSPLIYDEVKKAVLSAIHAEDILYVGRETVLMVRHADVGLRPFNQLSDGQIRIASIFCDLAMRCASLNSHLGAGSIAKTPGLVTIDELDLHLHPKWQQQVVGDLRRVFPLLQFIVTSHSPFLLQAAFEHGSVVDMATGQFVSPSDPSIEDIAENTMGVVLPQRGQRFQEMKAAAMAYYALLEQVPTATPEAKAAIKQKLDDALIPYTNDPAYAAFLEMHRAAAGV